MFVAIVDIELKPEKIDEFKQWFSESNKTLSGVQGFISRRLLESDEHKYKILVEHQTKESFIKMHQSPVHQKLHNQARSFFTSEPKRTTFTVAAC